MTHNTDCTVKDEFREEITQVAKEAASGDFAALRDYASEHDWESMGKGVGRQVYRVSDGVPDADDVVESSPCVIKFAASNMGFGGKSGAAQNHTEYDLWRSAGPELRGEGDNSDIPVFTPIKDAGPNTNWMSAPEVNTEGGTAGEATARLIEAGWLCNDIGSDNVGEMHGETVVVDYGMDCHEADLNDVFSDYIGELDRIGAREIRGNKEGVFDSSMYWNIEFSIPEYVVADVEPRNRGVLNGSLTPDPTRSGVTNMDIPIGGFDSSGADVESLRRTVEDITDELGKDYAVNLLSTRVESYDVTGVDGDREHFDLILDLETDPMSGALPDGILGDYLQQLFGRLDESLSGPDGGGASAADDDDSGGFGTTRIDDEQLDLSEAVSGDELREITSSVLSGTDTSGSQ